MPNVETSTADGYVAKDTASSDPPTQAEWDACHDATDGDSVNTVDANQIKVYAEHVGDKTDKYFIRRAFFYFNTNGIAPLVESVELWLYVYNFNGVGGILVAQEGTQADTLTTADFDAYTGNEFGHAVMVKNEWNKVTFNPLGISKINQSGVTKICIREYEYDYLDVKPPDDIYQGFDIRPADYGSLIAYLKVSTGIGIRIYTSSGIIKIQAETLSGHKLRVRKGGTTYGIPLVATDHADASKIRIYDGSDIKALAKC